MARKQFESGSYDIGYCTIVYSFEGCYLYKLEKSLLRVTAWNPTCNWCLHKQNAVPLACAWGMDAKEVFVLSPAPRHQNAGGQCRLLQKRTTLDHPLRATIPQRALSHALRSLPSKMMNPAYLTIGRYSDHFKVQPSPIFTLSVAIISCCRFSGFYQDDRSRLLRTQERVGWGLLCEVWPFGKPLHIETSHFLMILTGNHSTNGMGHIQYPRWISRS